MPMKKLLLKVVLVETNGMNFSELNKEKLCRQEKKSEDRIFLGEMQSFDFRVYSLLQSALSISIH